MNRLLPLLLLLSLAVPAPARATSVLYLTDAEQAQQSDAVVLGTITAQRVEQHPTWNRLVTISTVAVRETLHGKAPATLEVHQLKGSLRGVTEALPGSAELAVDENVVLFLHSVEGRWYPTALQQSKYRVVTSRLGTLLQREPLTAALFERDAKGRLTPIEEPTRKPIYTLDDLKSVLLRVRGSK